ncbi:MAG: MFS transporter [Dehalococcoidales bacterium]|nr:MFS transporter [Dehalococcoidales bacterium]
MKNRPRIFYGWWIVAASFIMFLVCGGITFYGFTAFFNPIAEEFGWSAAQVSFAFSLRSIEFGLMWPLVGFLIDKFGARKIITFGTVVSGLGFLMLSRTDSLLFFYATFLLLSIGTSCSVGMGQYVAAANWFSRRRTWVMGIISAGYAFSGIVGPVLVWLIEQYQWRGALIISGITILVVGIPASLVIRHRPEPYGYLPDGEVRDAFPARDKDISGIIGKMPEDSEQYSQTGLSAGQAVRTRAFWLLGVFGILTGFAQSAIMVLEMPYLTSVGISRNLAGWTILGFTGFSLIGRLGFGWIGDTYDKRHLLAIGAVIQFLGVLVFAGVSSPWMLIPFIMLYGPGYASQIPIWPAIRADYFGLKHFATIGGLQAIGWTLSGIIAPVLAGWVFDVWGTYRPIWLAYAILTAAAIPFVLWMKPSKPALFTPGETRNEP